MKNLFLFFALFSNLTIAGITAPAESINIDVNSPIHDDLCGGVQNVPAGWDYSCSDSGCTSAGTSGVDTTGHAQCVTEITTNAPVDGRGALLKTSLMYFGGSWHQVQKFRLKLHLASTALQPYRATIGLATDDHWQQNGLGTHAIGFRYSETNSRKWQCVLRYNSTDAAAIDSGITGDTSYHIFTMDIDANTSIVTWYIDGTQVCQDTTHFPLSTILTEVGVKVENTGGGTDAHKMSIDWFDMVFQRATAR